MLSKEQNEILTQVGRGTPGGEFQRRYWQPAALSEELPVGGAPIPVRLLGEDLVMFRDQQGQPGLLGLHCSHRGADLSYGRIEDGGLRCLYHGWLFDRAGRCLEQPGEPVGSTFHQRIQHPAYPCIEVGGLILTYMGPGDPPQLPPYEFFSAPPEYRILSKVHQDCNFQQGNEGNLDPQHLSFLHRMSLKGDLNQVLNAKVTNPRIEVEETSYGLRIYAIRPLDVERQYVRLTNFILPNLSAVAGDAEGYSVNWHVPIDDTHHWRYGIRFNRYTPMEPNARRYDPAEFTPDRHLVRGPHNRYLQDRDSMKAWSFIGLGRNFVVHDSWATEGAGSVQDRTAEHLGYTDKAIIATRNVMLKAINDVQEGREPAHVVRTPLTTEELDIFVRNDTMIPADASWRNFWHNQAVEVTSTRSPVGAAAE